MGSMCAKQGVLMCNNRHPLKYASCQLNPQDFLNQSNQPPKICVKCNRGVENCGAKVCWQCKKCNFYYCAKCAGFKTDVCPSNHRLVQKKSQQIGLDAFCDICQAPITGKAFHCSQCKFNICNICLGANTNKK